MIATDFVTRLEMRTAESGISSGEMLLRDPSPFGESPAHAVIQVAQMVIVMGQAKRIADIRIPQRCPKRACLVRESSCGVPLLFAQRSAA